MIFILQIFALTLAFKIVYVPNVENTSKEYHDAQFVKEENVWDYIQICFMKGL